MEHLRHALQSAIDWAEWDGVPITVINADNPTVEIEFDCDIRNDPPRFRIELIPIRKGNAMPTEPLEQLKSLLPLWEQRHKTDGGRFAEAAGELDFPAIIAWAEGLEQQLADANMELATEIRKAWMRFHGTSEEEMVTSIRDEPPVSVADELEQLEAVFQIQKRNADSDARLALQRIALQARSVLELDLGYTSEPRYGHSPIRHQLLWAYSAVDTNSNPS